MTRLVFEYHSTEKVFIISSNTQRAVIIIIVIIIGEFFTQGITFMILKIWSTPVRTPAFLQLIYGAGPSSADTERRYDPGWLHDDDVNYLFIYLFSSSTSNDIEVHAMT